jgi:hypothetical protein
MSNICDSARGHSSGGAATLANEKKRSLVTCIILPYLTIFLCTNYECVWFSLPQKQIRDTKERSHKLVDSLQKKKTPRDTQIHKRKDWQKACEKTTTWHGRG